MANWVVINCVHAVYNRKKLMSEWYSWLLIYDPFRILFGLSRRVRVTRLYIRTCVDTVTRDPTRIAVAEFTSLRLYCTTSCSETFRIHMILGITVQIIKNPVNPFAIARDTEKNYPMQMIHVSITATIWHLNMAYHALLNRYYYLTICSARVIPNEATL